MEKDPKVIDLRKSVHKDVQMLKTEHGDEISKYPASYWQSFLHKEYGRLYPLNLLQEFLRYEKIAVLPEVSSGHYVWPTGGR
jgi:hypothetical protein